jgi:polyisoprenoid-binding protein YceI
MQYAAKCLVNGSIGLLAAAISLGSPAFASGKHDFSASNSSLEFSVQILGVLKKRGQFTEFNGRLERTAGEAKTASVWLSIRSDSAQMRSKKDTDMVKGANFFAAADFPEVRFESEPFDATLLLDNKVPHPISGYLSLRGKRLSETLNLQVLSCKNLAALEKCSFQVSGKLGRAHYGMQSHRAFVGDDVRLSLTIQSEAAGEAGKVVGK